jgi:signal transduction histidine kinase
MTGDSGNTSLDPASPELSAWAVLSGDRWFWLVMSILGLSAVPYVSPFLSPDQISAWSWDYADIPATFATLVAVLVGIKRVRDPCERRFWQLVAVAYSVFFVIEVFNGFVPYSMWSVTVELVLESSYLLYYLALLLAVWASQSDTESPGAWRLHGIRIAGLGILASGFMVYSQGVPSAAFDTYEPWSVGLLLFVFLDVALVVAFLLARRAHEDARWRRILLGMAGVSAIYAVGDCVDAIGYLEAYYPVEYSPLWDLPRLAPEVLFIVTARLHLAIPQTGKLVTPSSRVSRPDAGSLVIGLIALPLLHVGLYDVDILDPALRDSRDLVVLFFLLAMGSTTLVYFRTLERERLRAVRESKLGEERYRSFVHARSDGIYRAEATPPMRLDTPPDTQLSGVEGQLKIAEVDDSLGRLANGWDPREAIGHSLVSLFPDRDCARASLRSWIASGYEPMDFESSQAHSDGGRRHFEYSLTGIIEDECLVRAWVTRSDVTKDRQAADERERLGRELEQSQKMESIGTLAGGIAHDFNNLLLPIIGFTEMVVAKIGNGDRDSRENLDQVLQASERAADLVQQVLSVSRNQPRQEVVVRTQDVVREAVTLVRAGIPTTVGIDLYIDDECPPVLGDPSRIHQVVINLCTNAAQAIGAARGRVDIRLRHRQDGNDTDGGQGWVELEIEDDGPGMDSSTIDRVFEPFFTTKSQGEGTGLGLSMVHGIVMSHSGSVTVESEPGVGTTVTVRLPVTDLRMTPGETEPTHRGGALRVMVVDDETVVAEVTKKMLEAIGHEVEAFSDPVLAHEALKARPVAFDLLVTDYTMPGLTGAELARAACEFIPRMRVIVMSGYNLGAGTTGDDFVYLAKPFSAAQLAAAVDEAVTIGVE